MKRRQFLKTTAVGTALLVVNPSLNAFETVDDKKSTNNLPRWRGFNVLDFFSPQRYVANPARFAATEQDFKWMADWGFDFVRIPMAYPSYLKYDPASGRDITPEETVGFREEAIDAIEQVVYTANKYHLHVSLNLHRAPGFCINAGFHEPFNLWKDEEAQQAFYRHWDMWAKRFKNVSPELLSFDLVNEPCFKEDMNDQFSPATAIPGSIYRKVAVGCLDVIHRQNADRMVVADGNNGGALVIPELTDLPIGQSCRGYYPHYVSHYRAGWVWKNPDDAPVPVWPGVINGEKFDRKVLEDFYRPWTDLVKQGVGVHCGECGCYNETPHDVFLAWFEDMLQILTSHQIGWALWNFRGDFGVLDSGRKDVTYEAWHGHQLDRKLLNLLQKY
ncbi:glycoside hydrolase family 5 protein [Seramator thermalis]|jgi:aryl-phospho-beta-D-glucosidase BglC (GH1 family)|uniref:glycoside hydrolase family 5 protein n=1 Tax=Seramator thermalis TaxID=2496270 RepID=UPI00101DBE43|nr:cellulase family glycosylhydrolase [Seramator thermalis]